MGTSESMQACATSTVLAKKRPGRTPRETYAGAKARSQIHRRMMGGLIINLH